MDKKPILILEILITSGESKIELDTNSIKKSWYPYINDLMQHYEICLEKKKTTTIT